MREHCLPINAQLVLREAARAVRDNCAAGALRSDTRLICSKWDFLLAISLDIRRSSADLEFEARGSDWSRVPTRPSSPDCLLRNSLQIIRPQEIVIR